MAPSPSDDEPPRTALEAFVARLRPWHAPLPALFLQGVVLALSRRVWTDVHVGATRSGRVTTSVAAHSYLWVMAFCALGFWLTFWEGFGTTRSRWGMREPSEAERGCVLALTRLALLLGLYGGVVVLWTRYVF